MECNKYCGTLVELHYCTGGKLDLPPVHNITDVSNIYFCNNTALLGNDAKFGSTPYPGLPADIS